MNQNSGNFDMRSARELLCTMPGKLVETDVEVDPTAEMSGVYRYVAAGGTVGGANRGANRKLYCLDERMSAIEKEEAT